MTVLLRDASLTAISNEAAGLHREHFGRGPGAVKSYLTDDLLVCVLSDPFTAVERTLIAAGEVEHVRSTREIHRVAVERTYKDRMGEMLGRDVTAYLGSVHTHPGFVVEIFLLGPSGGGQDRVAV
jgi:uncharacterized protein YbcI